MEVSVLVPGRQQMAQVTTGHGRAVEWLLKGRLKKIEKLADLATTYRRYRANGLRPVR